MSPADLKFEMYSEHERPEWTKHMDRGVKITHVPSGLVAMCHTERTPHRNKDIAFARLAVMVGELAKESKQ